MLAGLILFTFSAGYHPGGSLIQIAILIVSVYWIGKDISEGDVGRKDHFLWVIFLIIGSVAWGIRGLLVAILLYIFWSRVFH